MPSEYFQVIFLLFRGVEFWIKLSDPAFFITPSCIAPPCISANRTLGSSGGLHRWYYTFYAEQSLMHSTKSSTGQLGQTSMSIECLQYITIHPLADSPVQMPRSHEVKTKSR